VSRSYLPSLILLAVLWGSSYPFMREGVKELGPAALIDARLWLAAPLLLAYAARRAGGVRPLWAGIRRLWVPCLLLGVLNVGAPYAAIAWAEKHIDAGTASIANAAVPIFVVLLAIRFEPDEQVGHWRHLGLGIGLGGVALLVGIDPGGGWIGVAGALAVVAASISYAACGLYAKAALRGGAGGGGSEGLPPAAGAVLAAGSVAVGAVALLPLAAFDLPAEAPGATTLGCIVGLALLGTVGAQIVYFHMLALHGAGRVTMVTFLIPVVSIAIGALWLGEAVTWVKLGGLALILGGVALGSGMWEPRRAGGRARMVGR
jgi:drug/metabolite transporter (DMT)-like permease